jgi:hypothetical protein
VTIPGDIGPERLGEIVDGAAPRDERERAMLALMEETRALEPGAPEDLRRRVLDGPPPQSASRRFDPRGWLGSADGRRRLLVGAPAIAGVIALAIAIPALNGGSSSPSVTPQKELAAASAGAAPAAEAAPSAGGEILDRQSLSAPPGADLATPAPTGPDPGRAQQVTAFTRVQVADVEQLSRASTAAMRKVQAIGGFTAGSEYSVPNGSEGTNLLVFRVPVDRVENALTAFGRLGVVTGQSASIVDLTARLDATTRRVDELIALVADLRARLAGDPDDPALAAELARAEASLRRAEAVRAQTLSRTRLATVRLTLTTEGPPPPPVSEGRFGGPLSRASERLAEATAWLLGAIVLVGPFLLLAATAAWGALRLRGRSVRRLMGSV